MNRLEDLLAEYDSLGIGEQIDYDKFYLYSIIAHSTAIEGSTVTEAENRLLLDEGLGAARPIAEQFMNLDLRDAYLEGFNAAERHEKITPTLLCDLSGKVMKNTGAAYNTALGSFDSSRGELRLVNVSAGTGGKSYLSWQKVPEELDRFCLWVNKERNHLQELDVAEAYCLSFEAHYRLVCIHPWVDGNGRMARLLMNMIQHEAGLLPSIVKKNYRSQYISSLAEAQETGSIEVFLSFMMRQHEQNIRQQIDEFREGMSIHYGSADENGIVKDHIFTYGITDRTAGLPAGCPVQARKTLEMLIRDPEATNRKLAEELDVNDRTIRNHLKLLKESGLIRRAGSRRSGYWEISI